MVRGSQPNDGKEALCGRQPTILFTGSISSLIAFYCFQKNQKYKNIFAETIRGTKFQVQYWEKT